MAELLLGPLLRYVDEERATVWVKTDRPCRVRVVTEVADTGEDGSGPVVEASADSWRVAGHHYALVVVAGLRPGRTVRYTVHLDGEQVWPLPRSPYPPSTIRTLPAAGDRVRVTFGSCRWAQPSTVHGSPRAARVGPDALDTLAVRLAAGDDADRPDVLLLLGDQVYADEVSEATRSYLAGRRGPDPGPDSAPDDQVADYEEYTHLYDESWLDPEVRWLLSTVPSCMIFDDHDVVDDWNTSDSWREEMRATGWWRERLLGGLTSYWVYQHLGNLSPEELAADELFAAVRAAEDGEPALRAFAELADAEPAAVRWSYRRDFGRTRLLMVDTRAGRVLTEGQRAMVDDAELGWLTEQARDGAVDHLLVGTSLPWLLPPGIHDAESWNAALCEGRRGPRLARWAERVRRAADLEHWAAFRESFDALARLFAQVGGGAQAPATVLVLSGDVHHAYVAEATFPAATWPEPVRSRVVQLTCSPVHNAVPAAVETGFRFAWGRVGRWVGRLLARHGRVPATPVSWRRLHGPHFGNQLMTVAVAGRSARLRLERAEPAGAGAHLVTTLDEALA